MCQRQSLCHDIAPALYEHLKDDFYSNVLYSPYWIVMNCTVVYCIVLYCTLLYCAILTFERGFPALWVMTDRAWASTVTDFILYNNVHYTATLLYCKVQYTVTATPNSPHRSAVRCTELHVIHCTVLHCTVLLCTTLHCTSLHCNARHLTALNLTAMHCTALHCKALYTMQYTLQYIMLFTTD